MGWQLAADICHCPAADPAQVNCRAKLAAKGQSVYALCEVPFLAKSPKDVFLNSSLGRGLAVSGTFSLAAAFWVEVGEIRAFGVLKHQVRCSIRLSIPATYLLYYLLFTIYLQ